MRKLFPILLALIGLGGGVGAGLALRPAAEAAAVVINPCGPAPDGDAAEAGHGAPDGHAADAEGEDAGEDGLPLREYVKMNNQFIVPVVEGGAVKALVILSISLEVAAGGSEKIYSAEPKLRDSFLQVLFDHANSGGFEGTFTSSNNLEILRTALFEVARKVLGAAVSDVLIVDLVRQDS